MKGLLKKSDVAEMIDAATNLEKSDGKVIDSLILVYGKLFPEYVKEVLPNLRDAVSKIYESGNMYSLLMNNTYSERQMKHDLEKIRIVRDAFRKVVDEHAKLTKQLQNDEAACEKRNVEIMKLEKKGKSAEAEKAKSILADLQKTVSDDQKALDRHADILDQEGESYQKKVVEIITNSLEKMLMSQLECLKKAHDSAIQMCEQVDSMEWDGESEEIGRLEASLSLMTEELEVMEKMSEDIV